MSSSSIKDAHDLFWRIAEGFYEDPRVCRSTMMGLPCLRVDGKFFASLDHRTGHLLVKLPAVRVAELVASGQGLPFAPAGRTFREWVAFERVEDAPWREHLEEAKSFAAPDHERGA